MEDAAVDHHSGCHLCSQSGAALLVKGLLACHAGREGAQCVFSDV